MNKFDKLFEEEMDLIGEGAFKSMVTAGMMGLGALGASTEAEGAKPYSQPVQKVQTISDETILTRTLPLTTWAEGFRDLMYLDSKKIPTIGYGSNLTAPHIRKQLEKMGYSYKDIMAKRQRINEEDAKTLLQFGMATALKDAKNFVNNWDQLDPTAKIILVDMSYNLGISRLSGFENFKAALERMDYNSAKTEMTKSKWYSDVGRRSKRLVDMMDALADRS